MKSGLLKHIFRKIKDNYKRFLSLLLMAFLGVGFYAGIQACSPDLLKTLDIFFDNNDVYDIEVVSNLGLTDDDVKYLSKIDGIDKVVGTYSKDVYLNVVSGIRLVEPAVDLGTVLAVGSSFRNLPLPKDMVAIGEVGLTGEIRAVNMIEKRVKEAEKMGFKTCIIPESNKKLLKDNFKMDIIGVRTINEAMQKAGLR